MEIFFALYKSSHEGCRCIWRLIRSKSQVNNNISYSIYVLLVFVAHRKARKVDIFPVQSFYQQHAPGRITAA